MTPPYHLTGLVSQEEVELKFTAPGKPGHYGFTVVVRSDSYLGLDLLEDIKLDVKEAREAPTEHPQWEFEVTIFNNTIYFNNNYIKICSFTKYINLGKRKLEISGN